MHTGHKPVLFVVGWFEMGLVRIAKASMSTQLQVEISIAKSACGNRSHPLPDTGESEADRCRADSDD